MTSKKFNKRNGEEFIVLIDEKNYHLLEKYNWFLRNGCAATTISTNGIEESVYLHRLILKNAIKRHESKTQKRARIIFADGNKLNCRTSNISIQRDVKKSNKAKTSKYRGVSFDKRNKKWRGKITINKKIILDQLYSSEYEAWQAVDAIRKDYNAKNKNKLKRETWKEVSAGNIKTKRPSKEIYDNLKDKIDDKFNRYFKTNTDTDPEQSNYNEQCHLC